MSCATHLGFEPIHEMDDVGVVERLQHLQFIVNHLLVAADVLLQNDLHGDLSGRRAFGLADNPIGASTQGAPELVQRSVGKRSSVIVRGSRPQSRGRGNQAKAYFFS